MVEVWGVEPQSESQTTGASPSAVHVLTFPPPHRHGRRYGFSSFIKSRRPQSLGRLVPCFYDAAGLRRRRLRGDDRGLSRESYVIVVVSSFLVPVVEAVQGCRSLLCPSVSPSKPFTAPHRGDRQVSLYRAWNAQCPSGHRAWPCHRACHRAFCPCTARAPASSVHP